MRYFEILVRRRGITVMAEIFVGKKEEVIGYDFYPNLQNTKDVADKVTIIRGDILELTVMALFGYM